MSDKRLDESLLELCRAFNRHDVKYVVVGGFAVIMHGGARMTEDIDFFVENSPENTEKVKTALNSIYNDPSINEITSSDIGAYEVIRYGTPDDFYIDLIGNIGEAFSFKDVQKDAESFEVDGVNIPVCGLKTLIRMKKTLREKDRFDLRFLEKKLKETRKVKFSAGMRR